MADLRFFFSFSPLIYRTKGCDTAKPHKFIPFAGKRHEASLLFTKMLEEGIKPGMVCTYFVYITQTYEIMIKRRSK